MSITPDNIDVAEATRRGIPVTVVPPIVAEATADMHFGLMIAVARRMVEGDKLVRAGKFPGSQSNHLVGSFVHGKTIGLVGGGGRIGKATARRACGFGMRVLYWSPRRKPEAERELGMQLRGARGIAGAIRFRLAASRRSTPRPGIMIVATSEFALMKRTAFIVNTARGAIIDEAALVRALKKN